MRASDREVLVDLGCRLSSKAPDSKTHRHAAQAGASLPLTAQMMPSSYLKRAHPDQKRALSATSNQS